MIIIQWINSFVLTFTKAAGNEMKQRLNVSLHEEALVDHDEETLRHIQEQIQYCLMPTSLHLIVSVRLS